MSVQCFLREGLKRKVRSEARTWSGKPDTDAFVQGHAEKIYGYKMIDFFTNQNGNTIL